ncbi:hypothetical protein [Halococcoides cellulosivorans]|uniref:Uncharacterized protein n=1 Tax=Halococcoides cellulosivorans TaxID=1679096 RepID=A0A2R4X110_9EURY|nr:hypothetical protein [Halococcoides cellulosivorans]AWB27461.1 hypothetical protein HARCEL1_06950 [Halococcoides cellulosivorans]
MRRETVVIALLIGAVLLPMWALTIETGHNSFEEIAVQPAENSSLAPTAGFLPTPTEVSVYVSGVLSWLGVFAIFGFLAFQVRFVDRIGRAGEPQHGSADDLPGVPSFVESEFREIVAYWPARADLAGVALVGLFAFLTVLFATLFAVETLGAARLQFLGLYAALGSFSLAELVVCYTTYFLPSITVAEQRDHS